MKMEKQMFGKCLLGYAETMAHRVNSGLLRVSLTTPSPYSLQVSISGDTYLFH